MKTEEIKNKLTSFFKKKYPKGFEIQEDSNKYSYNKFGKSYTADSEVVYKDGTDIVCVEKKFTKKDLQENIQKWILLSIKAKKQNGNLYVFTQNDQKANFQTVIDKMKINLELETF